MYIKDMMHSRFSMKETIISTISLHVREPARSRAFCGLLHTFHSLLKLNHIPYRINIFPQQILFQASPCSPAPVQTGLLRRCFVLRHHSQSPL